MSGRVRQPRHQRQELGEATRPAIGQDQRDSAAAAGTLMHKMHPDAIDLGPEVTEPVQPAFLRASRSRRPSTPAGLAGSRDPCPASTAHPVPLPATACSGSAHAGQRGPPPHPDAELLCPEGSHPASLARYTGDVRGPATRKGGRALRGAPAGNARSALRWPCRAGARRCGRRSGSA
jgi:hypothetical protein